MGTLFLSPGKYKEPGFPLALQINSVVVGQGANTNNRSSVTHVLFRKGERLSRRRSGKCPGCWVRAREKNNGYNPYCPHCCPEDCEWSSTSDFSLLLQGHGQRAKGGARSQPHKGRIKGFSAELMTEDVCHQTEAGGWSECPQVAHPHVGHTHVPEHSLSLILQLKVSQSRKSKFRMGNLGA